MTDLFNMNLIIANNSFSVFNDVVDGNANVVDRWFLSLTNLFDGWGMLIFITLALVLSGVLSAIIGLERYRMGENAGMRTHALLSISCCFLMTVSIWAIRVLDPSKDYDISRIAAGTITGIGFLGAGVIIKDKFTVRGLSTATTLWISAAIGLGMGAGYILEAIVLALVTILIVYLRNKLVTKIDKGAPHVIIRAEAGYPVLERIQEICLKNSLNLKNSEITTLNEKEVIAKAYFPYKINRLLLEYLMVELRKEEKVFETICVMKDDHNQFENLNISD